VSDPRTDELRANLADLRARLDAACAAAGRPPDDVTAVVVTKTWPVDDVRRLAELGVRDVGENRDQEAAPKAAATEGLGLRWHFVGALQTNKCRSVARYADTVHSVDRPRLVAALGAAAEEAGRAVGVLVQVSLDPAPDAGSGRAGVAPEDAVALAGLAASTAGLELRGVMGVAPLGGAPRPAFDLLAATAAEIRSAHPGATWVSAGMSGDLEDAVAAGATHVRVGTAVLGRRPVLG
jgi:pyridoxal phosphate enzyme (YggS family)